MNNKELEKLMVDIKQQQGELNEKNELLQEEEEKEEVKEWKYTIIPNIVSAELIQFNVFTSTGIKNYQLIDLLKYWSEKEQNKRLEERIKKEIGERLEHRDNKIKQLKETNNQLKEEKNQLFNELDEVRNLRKDNTSLKEEMKEVIENKTKAEFFYEAMMDLFGSIGKH